MKIARSLQRSNLLSFALQLRDGRRKEEENQSHFACTLRHSGKQNLSEKAIPESLVILLKQFSMMMSFSSHFFEA